MRARKALLFCFSYCLQLVVPNYILVCNLSTSSLITNCYNELLSSAWKRLMLLHLYPSIQLQQFHFIILSLFFPFHTHHNLIKWKSCYYSFFFLEIQFNFTISLFLAEYLIYFIIGWNKSCVNIFGESQIR